MRLVLAPLRSYWLFVRTHTRFAAFGFLLTLASSFGQTFFISLSNDHVQEIFDLSHGKLGGLYSLATFASGATLLWAGGLIDRINLRAMTLAVTICGIATPAWSASEGGRFHQSRARKEAVCVIVRSIAEQALLEIPRLSTSTAS